MIYDFFPPQCFAHYERQIFLKVGPLMQRMNDAFQNNEGDLFGVIEFAVDDLLYQTSENEVDPKKLDFYMARSDLGAPILAIDIAANAYSPPEIMVVDGTHRIQAAKRKGAASLATCIAAPALWQRFTMSESEYEAQIAASERLGEDGVKLADDIAAAVSRIRMDRSPEALGRGL